MVTYPLSSNCPRGDRFARAQRTPTPVAIPACIAVAMVTLMALRVCFSIVTTIGESMQPALRSGQRLLVCSKWPKGAYRTGHIVIVVRPTISEVFVKRIVALGGDDTRAALGTHVGVLPPRVPRGFAVVAGDNREASRDSRSWGPIPVSALSGRVVMRLSSTSPASGAHSRPTDASESGGACR